MMCGTMEEGAVKKQEKPSSLLGRRLAVVKLEYTKTPFLGRVLSEDVRDLELKKDR